MRLFDPRSCRAFLNDLKWHTAYFIGIRICEAGIALPRITLDANKQSGATAVAALRRCPIVTLPVVIELMLNG
jgi:hypothetical protein